MWHKPCRTFHPWCPCIKTRCLLTHWGRDKLALISQTTFWNVFSWMKMYEYCLGFHWSLFLGFELTIFQHWIRWWLGADQATSHYLNQWWLGYWCIYASPGLNELKFRQIFFHVSLAINDFTRPSVPDDVNYNTLRPRQNGRHFPDDIFKSIFVNENV